MFEHSMASRYKTDENRQFNSPTYPRIAKRTPIKIGTWTRQTNFVIVKMDEFDIVLRKSFLLEHKVIPMSLKKFLVVTGSNSTIIL